MFLDVRHKSDFGEVGENGENGDLIWIFGNLTENWGQIPIFVRLSIFVNFATLRRKIAPCDLI